LEIERSRAAKPERFERIVVGVDPPAEVGEGCDACGIVVAGRAEGRLYVIADESCQGLRPDGWARRVAAAVARWDADIVVAEANNGGAMVDSVLKAAEVGVRVKLVHASRGKAARAEPVALRFEAGRALFAGGFPQLEDELAALIQAGIGRSSRARTTSIAGGGYEGPGRSPDRADAMVWAMTELSETRSGIPRVRAL
jgi:phage terminase large subunit-like protein